MFLDNGATPVGFRSVSVGAEHDVWGVIGAGVLCRRVGVSIENPAGTGWNVGAAVSIIKIVYVIGPQRSRSKTGNIFKLGI